MKSLNAYFPKFIKKIFSISTPIYIFLSFVILLLVFYYGIDKVYYQQDEWYTFGKTIYYGYANLPSVFTQMYGIHYVPLANLYYIVEHVLYGISPKHYLYTGLLMQSGAGVLFYILLTKLLRNKYLAFFLSTLFVINVEIYQVILNEVISYYMLSSILALVLFIKLYNYITTQKSLAFSQGFLITALFASVILVHEAWFSLLILIPLFIMLFKSPSFKLNLSSVNKKIILVAGAFILIRLILFFILPSDNIDLRYSQGSHKVATIYNIATVPLKVTTQYTIGLENLYSAAKFYQSKISHYRDDVTVNQDLMAITVVYDLVVFYMSLGLILAILFILYLSKPNLKFTNKNFKVLVFSLSWIIIMGVMISPQGRFFTSIESRYVYLFGIGINLLLGSLFYLLWEGKSRYLRFLTIISAVLYFFIWTTYSYNQIQVIKKQLINVSSIRKGIIDQIKIIQPVLHSKTIFYLSCEDDCYSNSVLGMPKEWIVPFQNGFGWTLLVVYSNQDIHKYAPFFAKDTFLWERLATGYKEIDKTGFGYFTDASDLKDAISKYKLDSSNVVALKYISRKYLIQKMSDSEKETLLNSSE